MNLALTGTISSDIAKVSGQFDALNIVLRNTKAALNELASGMGALRNMGVATANAWKLAAAAMERAARATSQMSSAPASAFAPGSAPGSGAAIVAAALASRQQQTAAAGGGAGGQLMLPPPTQGGTFAGGPGSYAGRPMMPGGGGAGGGGGGGGPIPLNLAPRPGLPAVPGQHDLMLGALGFGVLGDALMNFVGKVGAAGEEVGHLQAQLRGLGFTQEQSELARALALEEQRRTPGMTVPGALEIIRDLAAVTQSPREALDPKALENFSQAAVILSAAGKSGAIQELFKAMQMGELRGVLKADENGNISSETLQGFLHNVINTTLVTGGRIGPAEQLQFLKSSGLGGAMLSDSSLFADAIAPILSMGAARAGTGVQAFAQQFAAGKMSDAGAAILEQMGLLHIPAGHDIDEYKSGIGQYRFPPSVLTGYEQARTNPTDWIMQVLLPGIDRYMAQANGKAPANDQELLGNRMAGAAAVASRIPGGNLIGDIIRNFALIQRDRQAIATGDTRDYWANSQTDPRVKMQALGAALNGLFAALSGPVMDTMIGIIKNLTSALNAMSSWAQGHPETAGRIIEVATALGTLSVALAAIAGTLLVLGPMIRLARWGLAWPGAALAAAGAGAGGGALAAAGGVLRGGIRGGIYGYAAHEALGMVDPNDRVGSWIDRNIPGASWLDNFASHIGLGRSYDQQKSVAPSAQPHDMTVNMNGKVTLDGRVVGNIVANGVAKSMSGPSTGTTNFDVRAGTVGGNAAAP